MKLKSDEIKEVNVEERDLKQVRGKKNGVITQDQSSDAR